MKEKITDRKFSFILHDRLLLVAIAVHHILRIVEQSTFLWIETDFRLYEQILHGARKSVTMLFNKLRQSQVVSFKFGNFLL